jgi:hypothetical protein
MPPGKKRKPAKTFSIRQTTFVPFQNRPKLDSPNPKLEGYSYSSHSNSETYSYRDRRKKDLGEKARKNPPFGKKRNPKN